MGFKEYKVNDVDRIFVEDELPDQAGHAGEFLQTDGTTVAWALAGGGPGFFYPQDYGAVGNGIADDTAALQAMFNAWVAAGGGNISMADKATGGSLRFLVSSVAVDFLNTTTEFAGHIFGAGSIIIATTVNTPITISNTNGGGSGSGFGYIEVSDLNIEVAVFATQPAHAFVLEGFGACKYVGCNTLDVSNGLAFGPAGTTSGSFEGCETHYNDNSLGSVSIAFDFSGVFQVLIDRCQVSSVAVANHFASGIGSASILNIVKCSDAVGSGDLSLVDNGFKSVRLEDNLGIVEQSCTVPLSVGNAVTGQLNGVDWTLLATADAAINPGSCLDFDATGAIRTAAGKASGRVAFVSLDAGLGFSAVRGAQEGQVVSVIDDGANALAIGDWFKPSASVAGAVTKSTVNGTQITGRVVSTVPVLMAFYHGVQVA